MSEQVSLHAAKEGARHRRTDKGEREKERENENKWQAGLGVMHIQLYHVFRCRVRWGAR